MGVFKDFGLFCAKNSSCVKSHNTRKTLRQMKQSEQIIKNVIRPNGKYILRQRLICLFGGFSDKKTY